MIDEQTEVRRDAVTCPRSQCKSGPAGLQVWKPRLPAARSFNSPPERASPAPRRTRTWPAGGSAPLPSAARGHVGASQPQTQGRAPRPARSRPGAGRPQRAPGTPQPSPGAASAPVPPGAPDAAPRTLPVGRTGPPGTLCPARAHAPPARRRREGGRAGSPRPHAAAPPPCPSAPGTAAASGLPAARAPARPPWAALSSESLPAPGHAGADLGLARPGPASSRSAASLRRRPPHLRRDPRQAPGAARPAVPGALPGPRPRDPHLPPPRPAPCGSRWALPFPRPPLLLAPLPLLLPREAGSPLGPPPAARRLGPLPSRTRGELRTPAAAPALPRAPRAAPVGERVGWVPSGGGRRPATPRARGESQASRVCPYGPISCVHP